MLDQNLKRQLHLVSVYVVFSLSIKQREEGFADTFKKFAQTTKLGLASFPEMDKALGTAITAENYVSAAQSKGLEGKELLRELIQNEDAIENLAFSNMADVMVRIAMDSVGDVFVESVIPPPALKQDVRDGFREIGANDIADICDMIATRPKPRPQSP